MTVSIFGDEIICTRTICLRIRRNMMTLCSDLHYGIVRVNDIAVKMQGT